MDASELFSGEHEVSEEAAGAGWSTSLGNGWAAGKPPGWSLRSSVSGCRGCRPMLELPKCLWKWLADNARDLARIAAALEKDRPGDRPHQGSPRTR
jgi:hypothetical protein